MVGSGWCERARRLADRQVRAPTTLNADGTSHDTGRGFDGPFTYDGAWKQAAGEVVVTVTKSNVTVNGHLQQIEGVDDALGGELFERL